MQVYDHAREEEGGEVVGNANGRRGELQKPYFLI